MGLVLPWVDGIIADDRVAKGMLRAASSFQVISCSGLKSQIVGDSRSHQLQ